MRVSFDIPYVLTAKQGDRVRIVQCHDRASYVQHYTPKVVKDNAAALAALIAPHRPPRPLVGPLRLQVVISYPWRTAETKRWRAQGSRWKSTLPDFDNLAKQMCDVLQATGFFANDGQIASGTIDKEWTGRGQIHVTIEELEDAGS